MLDNRAKIQHIRARQVIANQVLANHTAREISKRTGLKEDQ